MYIYDVLAASLLQSLIRNKEYRRQQQPAGCGPTGRKRWARNQKVVVPSGFTASGVDLFGCCGGCVCFRGTRVRRENISAHILELVPLYYVMSGCHRWPRVQPLIAVCNSGLKRPYKHFFRPKQRHLDGFTSAATSLIQSEAASHQPNTDL